MLLKERYHLRVSQCYLAQTSRRRIPPSNPERFRSHKYLTDPDYTPRWSDRLYSKVKWLFHWTPYVQHVSF